MTQSFDVLVVGGGVAGMVASVRAAELGATVGLVEKGDTQQYLCNARYSGGIFHIAYQDPKLSTPDLIRAMERIDVDDDQPELKALLAGKGGELIDWLRGLDAKFIRGGNKATNGWMLAPPRPPAAGLDWRGRGPDVFLQKLGGRLADLGGTILLRTHARALVMKDGRCAGIEADTPSGPQRYEAKAVVLADGGFQGNLDMLREFVGPSPSKVKQRGAATGTGDGLRMVREVGGATTKLNRFYGHLLSRDALTNDKLWPYPQLDELAAAGIVVDREGRRFLDEGGGGIYIANVLASLEDPLRGTVVFDAVAWDRAGRVSRVPPNPLIEAAGATIHRGASIEELAAKAGLPVGTTVATVESYNRALKDGNLLMLDPPRRSDQHEAGPIVTAPFFAIPACAGITYTMGGIKIDANARVVRSDGGVIEGLYAAGATTGGIEGGERVRYVGGLCKSGVLGKQAAEHAVSTIGSGTHH